MNRDYEFSFNQWQEQNNRHYKLLPKADALDYYQLPGLPRPQGLFPSFVTNEVNVRDQLNYYRIEERIPLEPLRIELHQIIDTPAFWGRLVDDLKELERSGSDSTFFEGSEYDTSYYGSNRGRERSRYTAYSQGFYLTEQYHFIDYLAFKFTPPEDDTEFTNLVNRGKRYLIKIADGESSIWRSAFAENLLKNPSFWEDFGQSLSKSDQFPGFKKFLEGITLLNDGTYDADREGRSISVFLASAANKRPARWTEEQKAEWEERYGHLPRRDRAKMMFYDAAPADIKLQLKAKFPKDFEASSLEEIDQTLGLPKELHNVIATMSNFRVDSQAEIVDSLAKYLQRRQEQQGIVLPDFLVKELLHQAIEQLRSIPQAREQPTIASIIKDVRAIGTLFVDEQEPDALTQEAADTLVETLKQVYFTPLVKRALYRPTALFWNNHMQHFPGERYPSPTELGDHIGIQVRRQSASVTHDYPVETTYLFEQILPYVFTDFAKNAEVVDTIAHIKEVASQGDLKRLLFHQVEAIRTFMDRRGGIEADYSGTGKTLILLLTALNLLDQDARPAGRPGRILVVGANSVINNWEGEIREHIVTDTVDVTNLTFSDERAKSGRNMSLHQRLRSLEKALAGENGKNQIALVNYDIFRNPRFQQLLKKVGIDVLLVDEAHNIKTRILSSVKAKSDGQKPAGVARRTQGLYDFILDNPQMATFLATGTPYVKNRIEPLILAHLIDPQKLPLERIRQLKGDAVGTNRALREVMVRNRKEDVLDLPPKTLQHIPLSLEELFPEERNAFFEIAQNIIADSGNRAAQFYELLALEAQVKFPWIVDKVKESIADGKKVVLFTPFVATAPAHTAAVSTVNIADMLRREGVPNVEILDGKVDDVTRLAIQGSFLKPGEIQALVASDGIGGESLTLSSAVNNATEIILVVGPNKISRYIQLMDRIHRIGQPHSVTIHIPYVTDDILGRSKGTYDEQILKRLAKEIVEADQAIDGLFLMESKDIYQDVARANKPLISKVTFQRGIQAERVPFASSSKRARYRFARSKSIAPRERVEPSRQTSPASSPPASASLVTGVVVDVPITKAQSRDDFSELIARREGGISESAIARTIYTRAKEIMENTAKEDHDMPGKLPELDETTREVMKSIDRDQLLGYVATMRTGENKLFFQDLPAGIVEAIIFIDAANRHDLSRFRFSIAEVRPYVFQRAVTTCIDYLRKYEQAKNLGRLYGAIRREAVKALEENQ